MLAGRPAKATFPSRVSVLVLLFAGLAMLGWVLFGVQLQRTHRLDAAHLFPADPYLVDFYIYTPTFEQYHTPAFSQVVPGRSRFAYPPLVAPIYDAFYSLPHKTAVYLAVTLAVWLPLLLWALGRIRNRGAVPWTWAAAIASIALCYPAIFLLERGNLEIFVWAAVAGGAICLTRERPVWAATLFGVAAALKLYPILLLGLLLAGKRPLRLVSLGLATAVGLSAAAIWFSGPTFGIAARGFLAGVANFQQQYAVTPRFSELRFDHSLFSVVKVLALQAGRLPGTLTRTYYLVSALVFGGLFLFRVRRLPLLNRLLFFTIAMVLLPPVSYEYTLVHLYVPALLLAVALAKGGATPTRAGFWLLAALLFLLLPANVLSLGATAMRGQLQGLALLAAAMLACFRLHPAPWQDSAVSI